MLTTTTPPISASLSPGYVQAHLEKLRRRAEERRRAQLKENPMSAETVVAVESTEPEPTRGRRGAPKLSEVTLRDLHQRHLAGESVSSLAPEAQVSAATLGRAWKNLGWEIVHWGRVSKPARAANQHAPAVEPSAAPPFDLADYGYTEGPGREQFRKPEVEQAIADNDAWFERVRRAHSGDDTLDALFAGDEIFHNIAVTAIEDPRGLEPIWQRANGHRPADDLTLDDFMSPPVAAIAAWVGRLRAVREELKGMGITVEGKLSVTLDL